MSQSNKATTSIIITVFQNYDLLKLTLTSIYKLALNREKSIEIIIWDASPSPELIDLTQYELKNAKVFVKRDAGLYDGLNKAISVSNGCYILVLNVGDLLLNNPLNLVNFEESKYDIITFGVKTYKNTFLYPSKELNKFIHQGILYKKHLHQEFGEYISLKGFTCADYWFLRGAAASGKVCIYHSGVILAYYDKPGLSANISHFVQRDMFEYILDKSITRFLLRLLKTVVRFYSGRIYSFFYSLFRRRT